MVWVLLCGAGLLGRNFRWKGGLEGRGSKGGGERREGQGEREEAPRPAARKGVRGSATIAALTQHYCRRAITT